MIADLGLPQTGLPLLRELIHERTGLFYADDRVDMLVSRLAPLVVDRGFRSYLDLYYLLKYEDSSGEWRRVIDALSVQETYFWREADQIRAIVCHAVPQLAARGRGAPIRIWSIPCATGEEPLTIAMMLNEAGWFDRLPIEIHASDASPAAIARARAGIYRERSFRSLPPALRERYFERADGGWRPTPEIARRISGWSTINLLDRTETAPYRSAPIVFCRNAFIYFSPAAIRRVVAAFAESMPAFGYLCVGAAESLLNVTTDFALEQIDGAFVYVKRPAGCGVS